MPTRKKKVMKKIKTRRKSNLIRRKVQQRGGNDPPETIKFAEYRDHAVRFYSLLPCQEVWYLNNHEGVEPGRINHINYENKTFNIIVNNSLIDNVSPNRLLKKCGDDPGTESLINQYISKNYIKLVGDQNKKVNDARYAYGNCEVKVNSFNQQKSYISPGKDPAIECKQLENNYYIQQLKFDQLKEKEFLIREKPVGALYYEKQVKERLSKMKETYEKCVKSTQGYFLNSTPEEKLNKCGPTPDEIFQKHNEELREIDRQLINTLNERPKTMPRKEPVPPPTYELEKRSKTKRKYEKHETAVQQAKATRKEKYANEASQNRSRKTENQKSHDALVERISERGRDREFTLLRCPEVYYLKPSGNISKAEIIDYNKDGSYKIKYGDKKTEEEDNVRIEKLLTRCDKNTEYEIDLEIKELILEATQRLAESNKRLSECTSTNENNYCYKEKRLFLEQQYDLLNIQHRHYQIRGETDLANDILQKLNIKHEEIKQHYKQCNANSQSWSSYATSWFKKSSTNNICGTDPANENLVEADPNFNWQEYEKSYGNNYSSFQPISKGQAFANLAVHILGLTGTVGQAYLNTPQPLIPAQTTTTKDQPPPQPIALFTPAAAPQLYSAATSLPIVSSLPLPTAAKNLTVTQNVIKTKTSGPMKLSGKNKTSVSQTSVNQTNQTSTPNQNKSSVAQAEQVNEILRGMIPESRTNPLQLQLQLQSPSQSNLVVKPGFANVTATSSDPNKDVFTTVKRNTNVITAPTTNASSSALIIHPNFESIPPKNIDENVKRTGVIEEKNIPSTTSTTIVPDIKLEEASIQSSSPINENASTINVNDNVPETFLLTNVTSGQLPINPSPLTINQTDILAINDIATKEMSSIANKTKAKDTGYIPTSFYGQSSLYDTAAAVNKNPYILIEADTPRYERLNQLISSKSNNPSSTSYNKLQQKTTEIDYGEIPLAVSQAPEIINLGTNPISLPSENVTSARRSYSVPIRSNSKLRNTYDVVVHPPRVQQKSNVNVSTFTTMPNETFKPFVSQSRTKSVVGRHSPVKSQSKNTSKSISKKSPPTTPTSTTPPPTKTRSALKIYARSQVPFRHRRTLKAWNQIERRQMKSDDYRERMRQRRLTHKQQHDIKKYQFENRFNKNYNRLEWEKQRLRRPNGSYNSLQQTRRLQGFRNYQNNRYRYQNNIPSYNYNYNSNYSRRPSNNNRPVYGPSYNY
jgi:hypothetical protein